MVAMMSSTARVEDPWLLLFFRRLLFFVARNTTVSKDTFHYTQKRWEVGGGGVGVLKKRGKKCISGSIAGMSGCTSRETL